MLLANIFINRTKEVLGSHLLEKRYSYHTKWHGYVFIVVYNLVSIIITPLNLFPEPPFEKQQKAPVKGGFCLRSIHAQLLKLIHGPRQLVFLFPIVCTGRTSTR